MFDDLTEYLDQKRTYARELDDRDEPTEKIADKETFHLLDAERYIIGFIKRKGAKAQSAKGDFYSKPLSQTRAPEAHTDTEIDRILQEQEL